MTSSTEDAVHQSRVPGKDESIIDMKGDEVNDSPIEQVRLTVPITDDPSQPVLTFRTWLLGLASCVLLSFVNQFFAYRSNQLSVTAVSAQIVTLPLGKLMASTLPKKQIKIPLTKWSFSLNPGPFNLKEHVLITIFASAGTGGVYAVSIITSVKAFYRRPLHPVAAMLLVQTTQMLGYGWAGVFRKFWWIHHTCGGPQTSFKSLYSGYLFPSLSTISFICWIWKDSVTAQQIGSGLNGLGIGSFGLDWSTVSSFLGTPLAVPFFAIANTLGGFFLLMYIIVPIAYWTNAFDAKKFPIFSAHTFDNAGQTYNISRILNQKTFDIDLDAYKAYSKLHLSVLFAFAYGLGFAALMATISHVALFEGKNIWKLWRKTSSAVKDKYADVHTRLMKKNYEVVPQWWFVAILVVSVALSLLAVEGFNKQLQLPWWGLLFACAIALVFTLPIGVVQATTNMQMGLNVISEFIIGYIYPGRPLANVTFKTYGYISMAQALFFLQDFKLGHYMKIPPKSMFIVQFVGTIASSTVYFATAWWLLSTVDNICIPELLPEGSPWTCPGDGVFYNASIIWGVVGPLRMFGNLATSSMPPAGAVHYLSWGVVGIFFNFYIYRMYKAWWARHNYILSAGLDAGVAFMGIIVFFSLQSQNIYGPQWWGLDSTDHCPIANCPTAPGIVVEGCPVVN
ncbi:hypothetical protein GH714_006575 [Hevea brasiliensis]|uniref:Oligopeptide transporter n=1 Tax=Hevea brasiliensis TaxID=3981 RepID=A0A6A6LEX4_HEVBR|nr:hypothetical protein GH714_006575 [Hevea brasiliensis]